MEPLNTVDQVLLISGVGLPARVWDETRRLLDGPIDARVAPRPTGPDAGLMDYATAAAAVFGSGQVAVVAHSAGGVVAQQAATLLSERAAGLLGVSAVMTEGSFVSAMPAPQRWLLDLVMRFAGTRPPDSAIRRSLASGLDEATTDALVADFVTEPVGLLRDRVTGPFPGIPCGYVRTTRDAELSESLQNRFADRIGASWQTDLDTGHLPMLEDPRGLTGAIRGWLGTIGPPAH